MSKSNSETKFYAPPQSPVAIQPGDTGFALVGKGYNRFIWTFNDWYKSKKNSNIASTSNVKKFQIE